jgi:hypothetical protein
MRIWKNFVAVLPLLFVLSHYSLPAQTQVQESVASGLLTGIVVNQNTQSPVVGASVAIMTTKLGANTATSGKFTVKNIPAGIYNIRISAVGYEPVIKSNIMISAGKPTTITIELLEKTVELQATDIEASYFQKNTETITSTQLLNSEDVRRAPGVQEDVVRAVALLPGVGVTQAGRNDLVVRGGAPFENLFVVDNIEVPNINHFGSQGSTGGPLSLINIDFVREVSFSAGGFGARYGDRVSSLTNITLRNGNEERFGGQLNLSATGFGVIGEGPIGNSGSYLVSVRRSYLDFIFKAAGFSFIPEYWDIQTKVNFNLDNNNSLSFLTIGALDGISFNNETADKRFDNSRINGSNQDQYFSGLTWKHLMPKGFFNVTLGRTFTTFDTRQRDSNLVEIFKNVSTEGETSLRADFFFQLSPSTELSFGNTAKFASLLEYSLTVPGYLRLDNNRVPQPLSIDSSFTALRNGTFATIATSITDNLKLTGGVRLDYYNFMKNNLYLSPRLSLNYAVSSVTAINFSAGRFYQSPSFIWLLGDKTNADNLSAIRADQIILGYERVLDADLKFQIEGYYKWYGGYPTRMFRPQAVLSPSGFDDITNDIPFGLEPLTSDGSGFARGIEIFLQKKLGDIPLYGLISFTLNQTRFTALDGIERAGSFDSRIIFNASAGYRFNQQWEVSGKFRLATGNPTTPYISDSTSPNFGKLDFANFNAGERLALFHSLDVRVDKRWMFSGVQLVTYIDIQNIYSRKNENGVRWEPREKRAVVQKSGIGILPSIGVNVEF